MAESGVRSRDGERPAGTGRGGGVSSLGGERGEPGVAASFSAAARWLPSFSGLGPGLGSGGGEATGQRR